MLSKIGYIKPQDERIVVKQKTLAGILPVEISFKGGEVNEIMMTQDKPRKIFVLEDLDEIASIMGIDKKEIGIINKPQVLPMAYSTGLPDIILPIKSIESLENIKPDFIRLKKFSLDKKVVGVHAFTFKDFENRVISCRNFAPACGINEEAATGTSNGALGAYLYENKVINIRERNDLVCEQGYFMDRPSKINVLIEEAEKGITIKVGGKAVIIIKGMLFLNEED